MIARKKICILVFSEIARDGRVLRQVEHVRKYYDVDVIAYGPWDHPENVNYFQLTKPAPASLTSNMLRLFSLGLGRLNPGSFERLFWQQPEHRQALQLVKAGRYDLIHANDWMALPVAACAARGTGTHILFDAHEYTPAQFNQYFTGRYLKSNYYVYILRTYSGNIDAMITVSDGIADLYRKNFGWDAAVVRNAPEYIPVEFHPTAPAPIRLIHHGAAIRGRQLEDLIKLVSLLDDRFNLTFILVPTKKNYLDYLKRLSDRLVPGRISFLDPIPPASLVSNLVDYDIGVHLLASTNSNHLYALPNKLFDFIMAGLGIAIFPLPEMSKIVKGAQIGIVSPEQTIHSMAKMLNNLSSSQIDEFKKNSLVLAKSLNANTEMAKLMGIYAKILSTKRVFQID